MVEQSDVVIIGAGLAGLTAARLLHRLGRDVVILEREEHVGGRVRTDSSSGYLLDRGFQLYNPAYPAGQRQFTNAALDLRSFRPGVEIRRADGWAELADPLRAPRMIGRSALGALRGAAGSPWQVAAFAAYAARCGTASPESLRARRDMPLAEALRRAGVGRSALQRVVRPFLSGVFADQSLQVSRRYGDFVLRSLVRGAPSVPSRGMQALPEQLLADLPAGAVRTGVTAVQASPGLVHTDVGEWSARVVIVAGDAPAAAALLPGLQVPDMLPLTTWYFATEEPPLRGAGTLIVDGTGGPLANVAVMSSVAPEYTPYGGSLVAASAVGLLPSTADAALARRETARLLGVPEGSLVEVARYPIRDALPRLAPGVPLRRPVRLGDGILVIGDHRDTPSIQGALVSGERGAVAAMRELG